MAKATRDSTAAEHLEQNTCSGCELPMRSCWQFRDDDQHCPLCEQKILHLLLGQVHLVAEEQLFGTTTPAPNKDDRLWLYCKPGKPLLLAGVWGRGVDGKLRDSNGVVRAPCAPPSTATLRRSVSSFAWDALNSPGNPTASRRRRPRRSSSWSRKTASRFPPASCPADFGSSPRPRPLSSRSCSCPGRNSSSIASTGDYLGPTAFCTSTNATAAFRWRCLCRRRRRSGCWAAGPGLSQGPRKSR